MGKSKIIYGNETLIDLTGDTVTAADLVRGVTAHNKSGNLITGTYDKPSGSTSITSNGTHDVTKYASAVVNVPVPSGYINISDTLLYVTQYARGDITPSSNTKLTNFSLTVGFKPKIFVLRVTGGFSSTSSSNYIVVNSFFIADNNYNFTNTGTTDNTMVATNGAYYSSAVRGAQSGAAANTLMPTSNGVSSRNASGTTSFVLASGQGYEWHAWG